MVQLRDALVLAINFFFALCRGLILEQSLTSKNNFTVPISIHRIFMQWPEMVAIRRGNTELRLLQSN